MDQDRTSPHPGSEDEEISPAQSGDESEDHDALGRTNSGRNIDAMLGVGMQVQIVLGRSRMPISQLLNLSRGSIIELDKKIGDPVEIVVNDRLIARGDLVKLNGGRLGVELTEIVKDYLPGET